MRLAPVLACLCMFASAALAAERPDAARLAPLHLNVASCSPAQNVAAVGQKVVIRLHGCWGFLWHVQKLEGDSVKPAEKFTILPNNDLIEPVGAIPKMSGTHYLTLDAVKPGKSRVTLVYKRGPKQKPVYTLSYTIDVKTRAELAANSTKRAGLLKKEIGTFALNIAYRGPIDKKAPFCSAVLHVLPLDTKMKMSRPTCAIVKISKAVAEKLIDHLAATQMLGLARDRNAEPMVRRGAPDPQPNAGPTYNLRITTKDESFLMPLGWEESSGLAPGIQGIAKSVAKEQEVFVAMAKVLARIQPMAKPGPQGVRGKVSKLVGNQMPGVIAPGPAGKLLGRGGPNPPGGGPLSVPVHVFKGKVKVNHNNPPAPDPKHKQLVKIVQADKNGRYILALEPGEYTVVAEIDGKLYLNSFSGKGFWSTVTVGADEWKVHNIKDSSEATF